MYADLRAMLYVYRVIVVFVGVLRTRTTFIKERFLPFPTYPTSVNFQLLDCFVVFDPRCFRDGSVYFFINVLTAFLSCGRVVAKSACIDSVQVGGSFCGPFFVRFVRRVSYPTAFPAGWFHPVDGKCSQFTPPAFGDMVFRDAFYYTMVSID